MAWVLWPERQKLGAIVTADPAMILPFLRTIALKLLGTVVAVLTVIAAADYFFQYTQWFERQKMSPQEVKEEFRQAEGDPAVKGKLRQLRTARMRKRVMACPRPRWSSPTRPITRSRCATSAA
jgi:flagellar biosynthesis protein FlhB